MIMVMVKMILCTYLNKNDKDVLRCSYSTYLSVYYVSECIRKTKQPL